MSKSSALFKYAHKRQKDVFIQEGAIALEFFCSIISFIEDISRGNLQTINSYGIGIKVLKHFEIGKFVCLGTVMTTTLANHTGIDAGTCFGNSSKPCGHGLGIFGAGLFINSSSVENVEAIAVNLNSGIRRLTKRIDMPMVVFKCSKKIRIDEEVVFKYDVAAEVMEEDED